MEEKNLSYGNLTLTFEGQDSIDAEVLMQSLSSAIKAYKSTLAAIYDGQGAEIELNLKAFSPGSVDVVLESVVGFAPIVAPYVPSLIESTKNFLEIIKLKKKLKGKKPLSVEQKGERTKIVNHEGDTNYHDSSVYNFYINNPTIDANLASAFSALHGSKRPAVTFRSSNCQVQIEEPEYDEMCVTVVDDLKEAEYKKIENTVEEQLLLKSPDFIGNSKWSFYYDGKVIYASIEDELFMESLRNGKVMLFAGVLIPVRMRIEAYYDEKLEPVKKVYTILKITGPLVNSSTEEDQLKLDGFEIE